MNPPVTGGSPLTKIGNADFDFFALRLELAVEQTVELPVIWDAIQRHPTPSYVNNSMM